MAWRALTDAQWERIRPQLPREKRHRRGGRPRADPRRCFEGILWILWTGAPWSELPARYGSPTTCWRRLRQWEDSGVLLALWRALLNQLNDRQKIRLGRDGQRRVRGANASTTKARLSVSAPMVCCLG